MIGIAAEENMIIDLEIIEYLPLKTGLYS